MSGTEVDEFLDAIHEPQGTVWKSGRVGWRWEVRLAGIGRCPERGGWRFTEDGARRAVARVADDERNKWAEFKAEQARKRQGRVS